MSEPLSELAKQLSSKSDWAVVIPTAIIGFIADALIDVAPSPAISPAMCALLTGGATLSIKRGIEAVLERRATHERVARAREEASHLTVELERAGKMTVADELRFETAMTDDLPILIAAIRQARAQL